jgi:hypothetical protein
MRVADVDHGNNTTTTIRSQSASCAAVAFFSIVVRLAFATSAIPVPEGWSHSTHAG